MAGMRPARDADTMFGSGGRSVSGRAVPPAARARTAAEAVSVAGRVPEECGAQAPTASLRTVVPPDRRLCGASSLRTVASADRAERRSFGGGRAVRWVTGRPMP
ncbi:hypothetical protein EAO69_14115 [Streptomyces sp. me109]|nr:hypothetical protein EAO69_14115 [Streptomyces sp. me109]